MLAARITGPLAMRDTMIRLDEARARRLAPPHGEDLRPRRNWDLTLFEGAGGIRSTAHDMLLFAEANIEALAPSPNDEKLPETPERRALTAALRLAAERRREFATGPAMGLGWHITRMGEMRFHNGMTGGYHAWLAILPARRVGVVVLANTATMRVTKLGQSLTEALRD